MTYKIIKDYNISSLLTEHLFRKPWFRLGGLAWLWFCKVQKSVSIIYMNSLTLYNIFVRLFWNFVNAKDELFLNIHIWKLLLILLRCYKYPKDSSDTKLWYNMCDPIFLAYNIKQKHKKSNFCTGAP